MAIFIDTSYILALINPSDDFHLKAKKLTFKVKGKFVTSEAVLFELANALAKLRTRALGIYTIEDLRHDPDIEIVPLEQGLLLETFEMYSSNKLKEWTVTDCMSFIIMKKMNITEALTTDENFRQAGFNPLLLEGEE
jgi:hypothetical protein